MSYKIKGTRTCALCERISIARGLCRRHYAMHSKAGTLSEFPKVTLEMAFESCIEKGGHCWKWTGTRNEAGYGIFILAKKAIRAHRFSYQLWVGPLADEDVVMHTCDNPPCVNPSHLRKGTRLDNNRDAASKQRHRFGERHGMSVLSHADISKIADDPRTQIQIAAEYGITQGHVSRIKSGKRRALG